MSKDRARSMRLWPLTCGAALLWLAWAISAQAPLKLRLGEQFYLSLQRGCLGAWYWSPAERTSLGIHDQLNLSIDRSQTLANLPFAWFDPWGYGLGTPLWIPAIILTFLATRRYAITSVRDAPPDTRRARRWATLMILAFLAVTLPLLITAAHRTEPIVTIAMKRFSIENGALVISRPEDAAPLRLTTSTAASRLVFPGSVSGYIPPSRQSWFWFDVLPDFDGSTPQWRLAVPLWPFVVVLGWFAWKARKRASFRGVGLCMSCGYSRIGLPKNTPCPECGASGPIPNTTLSNTPPIP